MGLLKEFKEFAMRGNVVDLAVGVVIGAAFGKIVSTLVEKIVMPVVGYMTGGVSIGDRVYTLPVPDLGPDAKAPEIGWGALLQTTIDFIIIAFAIFIVIKLMNTAQKKFAAEPEAKEETAPPEDIQLLREIRDALKKS